MAQSSVWSIDVCRGLGISPLRINIWLSFSQADLGSRCAQELFSSLKFETCFSKICAHSERYRNLLAGIFEILTFYGNIAFPLSPVLDRWQWKRDVPKFCFQTIKKKWLKIRSYRCDGEHGKKNVCFPGFFVHAAVRGGTCAFTLKIVNTLIKNSSRDDRPSIST